MLGKKKNSRKIFYDVQLESFVDEDDYYRKLKDALPDLNFLYNDERIIKLYGTTGNKSLDPVVFFKIEFVAYIENEVSDRKLRKYIKSYMPARWFVGYDLDEEIPWHSTISRTRQKMPVSLYDEIFEKILKKCVDADLVGGIHQSQDSTLISANASTKNFEIKRPNLTVTDHYNKATELNNDSTKKAAKPNPSEKSEELKIEKLTSNNPDTNKKRSNKDYEHKYEPEAKLASKPNFKPDMYYKGNITADSQTGIITDANVECADVDDRKILIDSLNRITEKLQFYGQPVESMAADGNYLSKEVLAKLSKKNIEAYISLNKVVKSKILELKKFKYDEEKDEYICPQGERLKYVYFKKAKNGKIYKCNGEACNKCELRNQCVKSKTGRQIQISENQKYIIKLIERLKTPYAKIASIYRKTQTEGAFSHLKTNLGLRKFLVHGLEQVNKKFILGTAVYNLKKLIKYGQKVKPPLKNDFKSLNLVKKTINLIRKAIIWIYDYGQHRRLKLKYYCYI